MDAYQLARIEGIMEAARSASLRPTLSRDEDGQPSLTITDPADPATPLAHAPVPLSDEDAERLWEEVARRFFDPHDANVRRVEVRRKRPGARPTRTVVEVDMRRLLRLSPMAARIVARITTTIEANHLTGNEVWIQDRMTRTERFWHDYQTSGWISGVRPRTEEEARRRLRALQDMYETDGTHHRTSWTWRPIRLPLQPGEEPPWQYEPETPEAYFAEQVERMLDLGDIVAVGSNDVTAAYMEPGQNN